MQINGLPFLDNLSKVGRLSPAASAPVVEPQFNPEPLILANAYTLATDMGDALDELDRLISAAKPQRRHALLFSRAQLNLDSSALTATTLRSTEQINATTTSFTPFGPAYTLPATSTALPTIDGIYDGSNGSGTLTFEARSSGIHGDKDLRFWVYDPEGTKIDDFKVNKSDPIDQQYTLSNGLLFSLGAGSIKKNESFEVVVFADVGSVVDPNKPLGGLRNDNPNLQYGMSVTNGSFEINGETIVVNVDDTISQVLTRITSSAADVTAVFDNATESILLTQNTLGSDFDITLGNDTSGFLQAMKLDMAVSVPGNDGNSSTLIGELPQFDSVISGTFKLNGVDISIDITADSLDDVLARINNSDAAVTTRLINNRVYLQSNSNRDFTTIEDDNTGFFAAINVNTGRFRLAKGEGVSAETADEIVSATRKASASVDRLFSSFSTNDKVPRQVVNLQNEVEKVLGNTKIKLNDNSAATLGLNFDSHGLTGSSRIELDINALLSSLRIDFTEIKVAFLGETEDAKDGFVRQLLEVVNQFTSGLDIQFGNSGFLAGLYA